MTFNIQSTLQQLQSIVQGTTLFVQTVIGEPLAPPESMTAAIFLSDFEELEATLSTSVEAHTVTIRIYHLALTEPRENIEYETHAAAVAVLAALAGQFTLGGKVRAISFDGEDGAGKVRGRWGHIDLGGTIFKVCDITVPLVVDDSLVFAP